MNLGAHYVAAYVRNNVGMMRAVCAAAEAAKPMKPAARNEWHEGRATVLKMIDADMAAEQEEPPADTSTWPLDQDPPAFFPATATTHTGENAL